MAGGQAIGAQFLRQREQVGKLYPHVAANAGNRGSPVQIFIGEAIDHRITEAAFVVEDIMRDAERIGDAARVANILSCATGPRASRCFAVIIKL